MKRQPKKVTGIFGIITGVIALILIVFGLYVRFAGNGNPTGTIYILIGGALAVGGTIGVFFILLSKSDEKQ